MQQDPALVAKRQAEHDACTHVSQLNALYNRWREEDAAIERVESDQVKRIARLEARVRHLESIIGVGTKHGGPLIASIGAVIGQANKELRAEIETLQRRPVLHDGGVWRDDHGYDAGSLVTYNGGGWIAQRDTNAGERPGTSPGFRLAVKSDLAEVRKVVRAELGK
jgi:hypothetical protein